MFEVRKGRLAQLLATSVSIGKVFCASKMKGIGDLMLINVRVWVLETAGNDRYRSREEKERRCFP